MSEYINREHALEILNDIGGCGAEPESYTAGWDEARWTGGMKHDKP